MKPQRSQIPNQMILLPDIVSPSLFVFSKPITQKQLWMLRLEISQAATHCQRKSQCEHGILFSNETEMGGYWELYVNLRQVFVKVGLTLRSIFILEDL